MRSTLAFTLLALSFGVSNGSFLKVNRAAPLVSNPTSSNTTSHPTSLADSDNSNSILSGSIMNKPFAVTNPSSNKRDFAAGISKNNTIAASSDSPAPFVPTTNESVKPVNGAEVLRRSIPFISTSSNNSLNLPSTSKRGLSLSMNGTKITTNSTL